MFEFDFDFDDLSNSEIERLQSLLEERGDEIEACYDLLEDCADVLTGDTAQAARERLVEQIYNRITPLKSGRAT